MTLFHINDQGKQNLKANKNPPILSRQGRDIVF
jgi:hypothetical protein